MINLLSSPVATVQLFLKESSVDGLGCVEEARKTGLYFPQK